MHQEMLTLLHICLSLLIVQRKKSNLLSGFYIIYPGYYHVNFYIILIYIVEKRKVPPEFVSLTSPTYGLKKNQKCVFSPPKHLAVMAEEAFWRDIEKVAYFSTIFIFFVGPKASAPRPRNYNVDPDQNRIPK